MEKILLLLFLLLLHSVKTVLQLLPFYERYYFDVWCAAAAAVAGCCVDAFIAAEEESAFSFLFVVMVELLCKRLWAFVLNCVCKCCKVDYALALAFLNVEVRCCCCSSDLHQRFAFVFPAKMRRNFSMKNFAFWFLKAFHFLNRRTLLFFYEIMKKWSEFFVNYFIL